MASSTPPSGPPQAPPTAPVQPSPLEVLEARRTGGAYMIRGARYQTYYAIWRMLHEFFSEEADPTIRREVLLERLEDVDVVRTTIVDGDETDRSRECFQAKSSTTWNSSSFWKSKVLQNFAQAYLADEERVLTFRVVHQAPIPSKGYLLALIQACEDGEPLTGTDFHHWNNEFNYYFDHDKVGKTLDRERFSLNDLLRRIRFERIQWKDLFSRIRDQITTGFSIPSDGQSLYIDTLVSRTLEWFESRKEVTIEDVRGVVRKVVDDILKESDRFVVVQGRLVPVSFEAELKAGDEDRYFSGSAARPEHIGAELPVRRLDWERQIREMFDESDVTVIRASSGQGKSTLAWQVVKELSGASWTPYELFRCEDSGRVDHIAAFLKSRVDGGEKPLVVLDGLRSNLKAWKELAECTRDLPVKYVVTTREEDWQRFGTDSVNLRLGEVSLEMTPDEAQAIYETLREKGKLHEGAPAWQRAWEEVGGLLIEYVALLTGGQMLKQRIETQVKALKREPDAKACFEILRLVALADVLGLRLSEESLVKYVEEKVGFEGSDDEALRSLDGEFLKVDEVSENTSLVRGVHPVRSRYLSDHLNRSHRFRDSLIGLIGLIEAGDLFEFCSQAPLKLKGEADQRQFLEALAEYLKGCPHAEMVSAIEGVWSADAHRYWQQNRDVYDRVEKQVGSNISQFVVYAIPWMNLTGWFQRKEFFLTSGLPEETLDEILPFDKNASFTVQVLRQLRSALMDQDLSSDELNLATFIELEFWLADFGLPSSTISGLYLNSVCELIDVHGIKAVGDLFYCLHSFFPEKYKAFMAAHRVELIDRLCAETGILRIWEEGNTLHVEYFFEDYDLLFKKRDIPEVQSVFRFFPGYDDYCVPGLHFPLASHYLGLNLGLNLDDPKDQSNRLSRNELRCGTDMKIVGLWVRTIIRQYESPSVYEWQKRWFELRRRSVKLAEELADSLHTLMAGHGLPPTELDSLQSSISQFLKNLKLLGSLRGGFDPYGMDQPFAKEQKIFRTWISSWTYFLENFLDLIRHKPRSEIGFETLRRAVKIDLPALQRAYRDIQEATMEHFGPTGLEKEELDEYTRLDDLFRYFYSYKPAGVSVADPLKEARKLFEAQDRKTLDMIRNVLDLVKAQTGIDAMLVDEVIDEPPTRKVVLGLHFDSSFNISEFFSLFASLAEKDRRDVWVHVFCVHLIIEGNVSLGSYYHVGWDHLVKRRDEKGPPFQPFPILLVDDGAYLERLPGVVTRRKTLVEQGSAMSLRELFIPFWEWSEAQRCLTDEPDSERLRVLVEDYKGRAGKELALFVSDSENAFLIPYMKTLDDILKGRQLISNQVLADLFLRIFADFGI